MHQPARQRAEHTQAEHSAEHTLAGTCWLTRRTAIQRRALLLDELKAALRKARVQMSADLCSLRRAEPSLALVAVLLCVRWKHTLLLP